MEREILLYIQEHMKNDVLDYLMRGITFLSNSGWIWILCAVILLSIKKYRSYGYALATGLVLCFLIGNVTLKPLIARTRPYDFYEDFNLIVNALHTFSFPSGHTYTAFCGATVLFSVNKKIGYAALSLALLTAFSRLYLLVHYPSDVLAGAVMGVALGFISIRCVRLIESRFTQRKVSRDAR